MNKILARYQLPIIIISSLFALFWAMLSIYNRIAFALLPNQDMLYELINILADLPFLIPALLGLFHFASRINSVVIIPKMYLVLFLSIILAIILHTTTNEALSRGLPMVVIIEPICLFVTIRLLTQIFLKKQVE